MIDFAGVFISFFAVIDPIGTVPVFIAVTRGYQKKEKIKIAFKATLAAAAILLFFVFAGGPILKAMSVPLSAFQISGGVVLFLFALSMIFGESKPEQETRLAESHNETAIFPLAVPSIAGPGAMLAGNAPYIVNKHSGQLQVTGTAHDIEYYIDEYEQSLR